MHSCLLSCIELHKCDHDIYVIRDIYVICDMCALYFDLYICHVTSLCSFGLLPCFTPIQMSFISCTHAYFISIEYIMIGLGHISIPNSFILIAKSLYEPSRLKTSSLLHARGCIVSNHQKEGD